MCKANERCNDEATEGECGVYKTLFLFLYTFHPTINFHLISTLSPKKVYCANFPQLSIFQYRILQILEGTSQKYLAQTGKQFNVRDSTPENFSTRALGSTFKSKLSERHDWRISGNRLMPGNIKQPNVQAIGQSHTKNGCNFSIWDLRACSYTNYEFVRV